jgi:hypothetical protein
VEPLLEVLAQDEAVATELHKQHADASYSDVSTEWHVGFALLEQRFHKRRKRFIPSPFLTAPLTARMLSRTTPSDAYANDPYGPPHPRPGLARRQAVCWS